MVATVMMIVIMDGKMRGMQVRGSSRGDREREGGGGGGRWRGEGEWEGEGEGRSGARSR